MNIITPKPCAVCRQYPRLAVTSLARPGGRGYPGNSEYEYVCDFCGLLKSGPTTDIYVTQQEATSLAAELWNERVDHVEKLQRVNWILKDDL